MKPRRLMPIGLAGLLSLGVLDCQESGPLDIAPEPLGLESDHRALSPAAIGTETVIAPQGGFPRISGNRVVWEENRSGNFDIFMLDLDTGVETQITTDPADDEVADISGDRIVFARNKGGGFGDFDIFLYDILTATETQISTAGFAFNTIPVIDGDLVVWADARAMKFDPLSGDLVHDIFMFDLSNPGEVKLTTLPYWDSHAPKTIPAISGDRILWTASAALHNDLPFSLWMVDLAVGLPEVQLAPSGLVVQPDISGDRIVYLDDGEVILLDLNGGSTQITTTAVAGVGVEGPAISGNRIVWQDTRNSGSPLAREIYMYDLLTGLEMRITTPPGDPRDHDISGDRIVWSDSGIHLFDLLLPEEQIELLIADVEALIAAGTLESRPNGLIAKLNAALDNLNQGNLKPAINKLRDFIKQLNGQVKNGNISAMAAQELIDAAQAVIDQLSS